MTTLRMRMLWLLALLPCGCGGGSESADGGSSDPQMDGGPGDGDGDGDGDADGEADADGEGDADNDADGSVDAGAVGDDAGSAYPGFVPRRCVGIGCPHGECGDSFVPACAGLYEEPFDADYTGYCSADANAAYCVGSAPVDGEVEDETVDTYCINCTDGVPAFERCVSEGVSTGERPAVCL